MDCRIRAAHPDDAPAVSEVILAALRETNARDYTASVIERLQQGFGPDAVRTLIGKRKAFVAIAGSRVVGTAGLDGSVVRTVFVAPDAQGRGVGRMLMAEIERVSRDAGIETLTVPSSVTAESFYAMLGFKAVRDSHHGEERTIIMERSLASA
ncbi:GNAT family N-acetyltransferase [Reyranella sp.]|uniref:GNAT family N-acetyltransferase n=1 Tax=Reyranella sp. TaxID=1929291 RepID=UPI003784D9FD